MSQNLLESLIVLCELCLDGVEPLIHRLETPIEHFETPVDRLETKGDLFELPAHEFYALLEFVVGHRSGILRRVPGDIRSRTSHTVVG